MINEKPENLSMTIDFSVNGEPFKNSSEKRILHPVIYGFSKFININSRKFEEKNGIRLSFIQRKLFSFLLSSLIVYSSYLYDDNKLKIKIDVDLENHGKIYIKIFSSNKIVDYMKPRKNDFFFALMSDSLYHTMYHPENVQDQTENVDHDDIMKGIIYSFILYIIKIMIEYDKKEFEAIHDLLYLRIDWEKDE